MCLRVCVCGQDGVTSEALEAQFEHYGRARGSAVLKLFVSSACCFGEVRNVNLAQNKNMKGVHCCISSREPRSQPVQVPDTRIALVEFARRDDARKAMQAMLRRPQQLDRCLL